MVSPQNEKASWRILYVWNRQLPNLCKLISTFVLESKDRSTLALKPAIPMNKAPTSLVDIEWAGQDMPSRVATTHIPEIPTTFEFVTIGFLQNRRLHNSRHVPYSCTISRRAYQFFAWKLVYRISCTLVDWLRNADTEELGFDACIA